jgi:lysophospholipase L1-like esterase
LRSICIASAGHATIQFALRSEVIPAVLAFAAAVSFAAGCGEGRATGVKAPPAEIAFAPRVERATSGAAPAAMPLAIASAPGATNVQGANAPPIAPPASAQVTYLAGAERLAHLFQRLADLEEGRVRDDVRIVQYGDSHTASDMGTSAFRHVLQSRFGDGGRGFVSIGRPWKTYVQEGVRGYMTDPFEPARLRPREARTQNDGCFGLLGVGIAADAPGARAWSDLAPHFAHVEIDYFQQPRGGSFDVFVDGARTGRVTTRAAVPASGFFSFDVAQAPHQIEVRTVGDGDVRVFGMALDRREAGVVVDALGINGAQIFTPLRLNEEHFTEQLRHRAPDLVILAYGTNEALEPHLDDADYERGLVDLLGRVSRAAPGASCMLLGPPDLARPAKGVRGYHTFPRVLEIAAIQQRVARAAGCAFYDQLDAMGGPGTIAAWAEENDPRAQEDRVHLTRLGYTQVGEALGKEVTRAYDDWRAAAGLPPTGAAKTWNVARR